jgi:RNA polymerase sigma-70 factor (ECF subfamily)
MKTSEGEPAKRQEFDELSAKLRPDLYRYAFWLCRDNALAEDLVQETLLRAWRSVDSLRQPDSVKQWLLTILRREHARHYERKRLETQDIDDLSPSQQAMLASSESHEIDDMRKALFCLSDEYREPLVLQVLMGYSTVEIAEMMGIKQGAVLTRLSRARKTLKSQIAEEQSKVKLSGS